LFALKFSQAIGAKRFQASYSLDQAEIMKLSSDIGFAESDVKKWMKSPTEEVFEEVRTKLTAISSPKSETSPSENKSPLPNMWGDMLMFIIAFAAIIAVLVFASTWVSPVILGVIIIAAILVFLLISAMTLRRQKELSEANFMVLVKEVIKRLPLLRQLPKK
jgi:Flp pilus assembly protein TadB